MTEDELKKIIFAELKQVAPECDPAEVDPDENIGETMDIDSCSFLQPRVGHSGRTGIDITEADYEKVFTVGGHAALSLRPWCVVRETSLPEGK